MIIDDSLYLTLPQRLSQEAATEVLTVLRVLLATLEARYRAPGEHNAPTVDERQLLLWDDPPL